MWMLKNRKSWKELWNTLVLPYLVGGIVAGGCVFVAQSSIASTTTSLMTIL